MDVGKTSLNSGLTGTVSVNACLPYLQVSSNEKKPISPCRLLMKLKGIYHNPRKTMMIVKKVKQKSLLS